MDRSYRPNKYVLRAPPPIPPRPGSVPDSASYERAPALPPRPSLAPQNQSQQPPTQPPPYDYRPAHPQYQNISRNSYAPTQTEQYQSSPTQQTVPGYSPAYFASQREPEGQPPPYEYQPAYPQEQIDPSSPYQQDQSRQYTQQIAPEPARPPVGSEHHLPQRQPQAQSLPHDYHRAYPQDLSNTPSPYDEAQTNHSHVSQAQQIASESARPPIASEGHSPQTTYQPEYRQEQAEPQYLHAQSATEIHHSSPIQESEPQQKLQPSFWAKLKNLTPPSGTYESEADFEEALVAQNPALRQFYQPKVPQQSTRYEEVSYVSQEPEQQPALIEPLAPPPLFSQRRKSYQKPSVNEEEEDLTAKIQSISLQETNYPPKRAITPPPPKVQYDPPAKFALRRCPTTIYKLTSGGTWYIHPQVPDFTICAYCYEKHIRSSNFEGFFNCWNSPPGSKPDCFFSSPRVEEVLWPRALQSSSLTEILNFFSHRLNLSVRSCPGEGKGVAATEAVKWYQLSSQHRDKFPMFAACEACYEDVLLASPLRDAFAQCTEPQASDTLWACDVAVPYIEKLALKTDLDTFISGASHHLNLPACEKQGKLVPLRSRKWYHPRSAPDLTICEHCYNDFAFHTPFKDAFQPFNPLTLSQRRCILGYFQSRAVWAEALLQKSLPIWTSSMTAFTQTPACTLEIPVGTLTYQITGVANFDICQSCYVGLIQPYGLSHFFHRLPPSNTTAEPRACDLNPAHPRFASYAYKLDEALITATFSVFANYVSRTSTLTPCPGINLVKGRQWYGLPECRICPSCYEDVIRNTSLSHHFPDRPETLSTSRLGEPGVNCDMFSARMRGKYRSACENNDFSTFLQFASYRATIYAQTVPEMRRLVQQAKLDLNMQRMHNTTSSFYNSMDGASAWQYNHNVRYTGAGVGGSFATPWGVTGAQEGNAAWGYMQGIQGMSARVRQLEGLWKTVE
ncbi:hypothetical protein BJY04DRAFT_217511 [Aspergillus karnatakaensis]|uniref:uncharacterized protein n=1 Tax=Aspergillus karnatakaensis TaxID=1810916 RepID=UPI003CCD5FA0